MSFHPCLFLGLSVLCGSIHSDLQPLSTSADRDSQLEHGRQQLDLVRSHTSLPKYGSCWKKALEELEQGCKHLTDEEQSYLALKFANCFLERSGMETYPCKRGEDISNCLVNMDNNAFTSYSNFFTHTQNMCYFLQSQVWHEETENVMSRLSDTSSKVATKIEESSDVQERIISNQKETLEYQRQIVANGSILSKAIELSKVNVREMLAEFKSSTDEQRGMIFEIFERVNKLQNMVVSEVSWLYTVFFYGSCLLIVYLGTATRRTADARLWLYCVLSINFLLERAICQSSLPSDGQQDVSEDLPETIYHRIWLIRKTSIFACFCVTGYIAVKYVDYNRVNNKLLEDIRKQNADLKMKMEAMQVMSKQGNNEGGPNSAAATSTTDGGSAATRFDLTDAGGFATNPFFPEDHVTDLGELAEDESSSDDTISVNSTMTDRTYLGGTMEQTTELSEESDSGDEDEFMTALNSKEHSPKSLAAQQFLTGPGNKSGRVSRSSKGGKTTPRTSSRATTPLQSPNHSYNLRTRASTLINNNPILEEESPESFHKTVLAKLKVTQRNSAKLSLALKKASMYSSDEN